MIFEQTTYDLDELSQYNLHVHTVFSTCAKYPALLSNMLRAAEDAGLKGLAITDHFNEDISSDQFLEYLKLQKEETDRFETNLNIFYGAELSAYKPGQSLENEAVRRALDYRLYTANHFHLDFWGQPEEKTPRAYALYMLEIMHSFIKNGRAHCFAHPFIGRFIRHFDDKTTVTKALKDRELGDIFCFARENGVAWEINSGAILGDPDFAKRYWNIGRECGVTFHYGTDCHRPEDVDTRKNLDLVKKILS